MEIIPGNAVRWSHLMAERILEEDSLAVDLTAGNGYDTLFLAEGAGRVVAMDIQEAAVASTNKRLEEHDIHNVKLICDSHEKIGHYVEIETVDVFFMNLGYLPKGDKKNTTKWETTKTTLELILKSMKKHGLFSICVYPGHDEGARERRGLEEYCKKLNPREYRVTVVKFPNQQDDSPYWIGIERF